MVCTLVLLFQNKIGKKKQIVHQQNINLVFDLTIITTNNKYFLFLQLLFS